MLILDAQPAVRAGHLDEALELQIDAIGKPGDAPVRWKLEPQEKGVLLTLLSTRCLQGAWDSAQVQGRWRLSASARPE